MSKQLLLACNLEEVDISQPLEAPSHYQWKIFQSGYEEHWNDVQHEIFEPKIRHFRQKYIQREETVFIPDHFFFVFKSKKYLRKNFLVGINTAEVIKSNEGYIPNLDYCGVLPEHQGHGLGRLLVQLVMRRFKADGFSRATLRTPDVEKREKAIRLYRGLGWKIQEKGESEKIRNAQRQFAETPERLLDQIASFQ